MQNIKQAYVHAMHGLGAGLYSRGMLREEPTPRRGDFARWAHSLFAIYDIDAMIRLDLPWWTLRSAKLIERFLQQRPRATAFEYGPGAGTVFLAKRAEIVISAGHDPRWHALVTEKVAGHPNVLMTLEEPTPAETESDYASSDSAWCRYDFRNYVNAIDRFEGLFDLIVIDGRCRSRCLQAALRRVKPDGLILFDNAGRKRYRNALEECSLTKLVTKGLTASLPFPDSTILMSPDPKLLQSLAEG